MELLVVIGIIGLLLSVLMPALSKARAAANRAVCLSNIRQLGMGVLMYCNANKGWFPTCGFWASSPAYKQYPDDWIWWQANRNLDDSPVARLLGVRGTQLKNLLRCPSDVLDGRKVRVGIDAGQGPYLYSYGMNIAIGSNDKSGPGVRTKVTSWRSAWRKIMLTELVEKYCTASVWEWSVPLTHRHGTGKFHGDVLGFPELSRGATVGAGVSAMFIDGHAESIDQDFACDETQFHAEAR